MKTILVVDDSKTARLTLKRKLDLLNYQVEMADSGEAAIELLQQSTPPDLIFMDVLMGNMSGYEAAAEILKNPMMVDVPIVMCTSKDSQEDRDEAARNGAKGFIIKPISDEALEHVLQTLVTERVHAPAVSAAAPAPQAAPAAMPTVAKAPFVITDELENLVRQMVEQANLQRAEEAAREQARGEASQLVHAALGEHLHQVEDLLEGKISLLSDSLAALHSAHDQAQAQFADMQQSLSTPAPAANIAGDLDERLAGLANLVTQHLRDFEAEEHSKRAIHELDLQTRLEQTMHSVAEQTAQQAAERAIAQAQGSHFAMMDERVQALGREISQLQKATPASSAPDETALLARMESLLDQRINEALPRMIQTHASEQLAAHIAASDEKFLSIKQDLSSSMQAVSDALHASGSAPTAAAQDLPEAWMQQLLDKQDAMLEQRFNHWSAQMDEHLAQTERDMLERVEARLDGMELQQAREQMESPTRHGQAAASNLGANTGNNKIALGLAALGVVLALIALFN